jgi:hypothetical protein
MDGEDERLGKIGAQRLHAVHLCTHVKESCLDRMILFGEDALRKSVQEFTAHYHLERNHQGLGNRRIALD